MIQCRSMAGQGWDGAKEGTMQRLFIVARSVQCDKCSMSFIFTSYNTFTVLRVSL